jgi:poly(3-hydroxybutyrate) depolymerase
VQVASLESSEGCDARTTVTTAGVLTVTSWWHCTGGTRLAFAAYRSGGHSFPQPVGTTPSGGAVIWSFFTGSALVP